MPGCLHAYVTVKAKPRADGRWDAHRICQKCDARDGAIVDSVPPAVAQRAMMYAQIYTAGSIQSSEKKAIPAESACRF